MLPVASKAARKILLYFVMNPKREHHLRELASLLSLDPGNLSREMNRIASMGLLKVVERGRLKLFSLNQTHPIFKEVKGLLLKTEGAEILLRNALENLEEIQKAFIYGSFASGAADAESDIDLLIVGNVGAIALAKVIRPLEKRFGRSIQYRMMSGKEFDERLKKKDPFLTRIMQGKTVPLVG